MTAVPERVLHWLYNNLKSQYAFTDRTYSDIVQALTRYPSLLPKTEVYTYDDGSSALLLHLHGTVPVRYRNAEYRYPVAVWLPQEYPRQAPMVYVIPSHEMRVRPGQHVSAEGRVYHPYLAQWGSHWERSSVSAIVSVLLEVFAKEPPLFSPHAEVQPPSSISSLFDDGYVRRHDAPRPPPKVSTELGTTSEVRTAHRSPRKHDGVTAPSLPPKPPIPVPSRHHGQYSDERHQNLRSQALDLHPQNRSQDPPRLGGHGPGMDRSQGDSRLQFAVPRAEPIAGPPVQRPSYQREPSHQSAPPGPGTQRSSRYLSQTMPARQAKKPIEDLMSSPLESPALATTSGAPMPAPPIPPNPEKDALLRTVSTSLVSQAGQITSRNIAAIASLESQHTAMQHAQHDMRSELSQLKSLDAMLSSNEKILHETLRDADKKMDGVRNEEKPNVDDVLVAPTTVTEQLYGLIAEEQALGDAMFALTRALDRGRISADVYIKQTRTLARESFMKKALIRKIARGLQLDGA